MKYYLLILCLLLVGCQEDNKQPKPVGTDNYFKRIYASEVGQDYTHSVTMDNGQIVEFVTDDAFGRWLQTHKNINIQSITAADWAGHGLTSAFVIVYKKE